MLQSMRSQKVRHDLATEQHQQGNDSCIVCQAKGNTLGFYLENYVSPDIFLNLHSYPTFTDEETEAQRS